MLLKNRRKEVPLLTLETPSIHPHFNVFIYHVPCTNPQEQAVTIETSVLIQMKLM